MSGLSLDELNKIAGGEDALTQKLGNLLDNKVTNRYSGNVQGNLLDLYDIPTYNLKLYATGFEALETLKANDSIDDLEGNARDDFGSATGKSTNNFQLSPADVIILAQTGVTAGVGIDNLEIFNVPGKTSIEKTCNFKITQPGAADFIDQLYWTATKLGIEVATQMPLVLEIDFQGYQESSTTDVFDGEGGQIKHIAGPYRYLLSLRNFDITIGPEGSEYNFTTVVLDDTAFADKFFTLKAAHSTSGATIQDHLTDLAVKMNKRLAGDDEDESGTVDTITWDLSEFVSEEAEGSGFASANLSATADEVNSNPKSDKHPKITNQSVINDRIKAADQSLTDEQINAGTQAQVAGIKGTGTGEVEVPVSVTVKHVEDDNLFACLGRILSLNSDFMSHATRTKFAEGDPAIGEDDEKQTHVWWYTIKSKVTIGEYDDKKKTYSKHVTYKPLIINTPSTSTGVTTGAFKPDGAFLTNFDIQKAYEYTYTGRNDQILNVNISHRHGIALLLPKDKGMGGSSAANLYAVDQAKPLAAEDVTNISDLFDLFKKGKKIFDTLKNFDSDTLKDMAANAGFSSDKIKDLISDTAGQAAQDLANALAGAVTGDDEIKRLIKDQVFGSANSPTESDDERQKQIDQYYALGEYKAQPSGYEYSADLLNFEVKETTAEEDASTETSNNSEIVELDKSSKAAVYPATTYAGAQTSVFNYLYNQNKEPSIMKKLDLEIRGDPYYLGDSESSLGDFKFDTDGDNFFLFMLNNPRRFDMDIDEEDNNTGEWNKFNTSWTMSGIYRLVSAQNNFNNGVFTTSIVSVKETGVDLSKVSPEDLANYNITSNQNAGDLADKGLGDADGSGIDPKAFTDPVGYINGQISGGGFGGLTDSEIVDKLQADGKINSSQAQAWRDAQ